MEAVNGKLCPNCRHVFSANEVATSSDITAMAKPIANHI